MVCLWVYQRFILNRLQAEAVQGIQQADAAEATQVFTGKRPAKTQLLIRLRLRAYDEIVGPLEPYVAVYVLFGVPAVTMATDYCVDNSGRASQDVTDCQHTCEMVRLRQPTAKLWRARP